MPRLALPQNFIKSQGTLIEDFENFSEWTVSGGPGEADIVNSKTGSQSLKMTTTGDGGNSVNATKTITAHKFTGDVEFWVYLPDDLYETTKQIMIFLSPTANFFGAYFYYGWLAASMSTDEVFKPGWNVLRIPKDMWSNNSGASWDSPMVTMRVRIDAKTGKVATASFDSVIDCVEGVGGGNVLITFDDASLSAYTEGFAYMDSKGLKGTMFVAQSKTDQAGNVTTAQLTDAYSKGWAISNHTANHTDLSLMATQADMENEIKPCTDWLLGLGFDRSAYYMSIPFGKWNKTVLSAIEKVGMKATRSSIVGGQQTPVNDKRLLRCTAFGYTDTLAKATDLVDKAITRNFTQILLFHELIPSATNANQWSIANFRALIDYIVARKVNVLTIDEFDNRLTNPRYRSLPLSRTTV